MCIYSSKSYRRLYLVVELCPDVLSCPVDQLECVAAVAVHVAVTVRDPAIGEQHRYLVHRLWLQRDEVPEQVWIL